MIVPQFWAEGRLQRRESGRQVTVRRFGWSDESQEAAQRMADERASEALERAWSGEKLDRREPKVPYNGAEGIPIREEIVERHGETVITRNSYGARCLNTPNVLFADIDFDEPDVGGTACFGCLLILTLAVLLLATGNPLGALYLILIVGLVWMGLSAMVLPRVAKWIKGDPAVRARKRITAFLERHPDWALRLYRTPGGLRLLATHRTFDPEEPTVEEFFQAVDADALYVLMCKRQRCFRARVSPKPWRIGIEEHMRPRPGVWPVRPERLPLRQSWIERYEQQSKDWASCRFVEALGSGAEHPEVRKVQRIHDEMCRAWSDLPLG